MNFSICLKNVKLASVTAMGWKYISPSRNDQPGDMQSELRVASPSQLGENEKDLEYFC